MQLKILTPDKTIYEGKVIKATFPGTEGTFQVLYNHAPLVSTLEAGDIIYDDYKGTSTISIKEGIINVLENEITVLAEV